MLLASRSLLTAAILVLFVASPAAAGTLDLFTFESQVIPGVNNQGWWSATLANDASNDNFFVGREFDNLHHGTSGNILRDYFNFDLSAVTGSVVSATLFLRNSTA